MARPPNALVAVAATWVPLLAVAAALVPTVDVYLGPRDLQDLWPLGMVNVRGELWRLSFLQTVQLQLGHHVENRYGMVIFLWPAAASLIDLARLTPPARARLAASTLPVCALALLLSHVDVPQAWRAASDAAGFLGLQAGIPEDRFRVWAWATTAVCALWTWAALRVNGSDARAS